MHITFLTLFLGLVAGRVPIELAVTSPVAETADTAKAAPAPPVPAIPAIPAITAIEVSLDGGTPARLLAPYHGMIDLGPDLLPHHLVARGVDATGREVDRAEQWLNLPQPWALLTLLPESRRDGRLVAVRTAVQSRTFEAPAEVAASLDGKVLPAVTREGVTLPAYDPKVPHLLTVEARFANGETARRDLAFGGDLAGEVATELTQILVRPRGTMPSTPELQGGFSLHEGTTETALSPTAVEEGLGDILIVRDPAAVLPLKEMPRPGIVSSTFELPLGREDRLRFVDVSARSYQGAGGNRSNLFNLTQEVDGKKAGLYWRLAFTDLATAPGTPQLADAVAVAAVQALAGQHRRVVLLVLSGTSGDASRFAPAAVRKYLAALGVPLRVWSLRPPPYPADVAAWGAVEDVSGINLLRAAHRRLKEDLDSQRIVWFDGRHLPGAIRIAPKLLQRLVSIPAEDLSSARP